VVYIIGLCYYTQVIKTQVPMVFIIANIQQFYFLILDTQPSAYNEGGIL